MWKIRNTPNGVAFNIRVQPRASKNEVAGIQGDELRIRLTAPPVDGEANKACIAFFAQLLGVPKSSCSIIAGEKGRSKVFQVIGLSQKEIEQRLLKGND